MLWAVGYGLFKGFEQIGQAYFVLSHMIFSISVTQGNEISISEILDTVCCLTTLFVSRSSSLQVCQ